jgi:hypothetical protein
MFLAPIYHTGGTMATEPKEQKGVLITGPSGEIYNIPAKELQRYAVTRAAVERTILDAEAAGFVGDSGEDALGETEEFAGEAPPPPPGTTIINIFVGPHAEASMLPDGVAQPQARTFRAGSTMVKVAAGSTVAVRRRPIPCGAATFYGKWEELSASDSE